MSARASKHPQPAGRRLLAVAVLGLSFLAGAACAGAFGAMASRQGQGPARPAEEPACEARVAEAQKEQMRLRALLSRREHGTEKDRDGPAALGACTSAAVEAESAIDPQTLQYEFADQVDRQFERERADPSWSQAKQLSTKVSEILPSGSSLQALECRATLCRVETSHPDLAHYRDFLAAGFPDSESEQAGSSSLWRGSVIPLVVSEPASDRDEVVAVSFLVREGHAVPTQAP